MVTIVCEKTKEFVINRFKKDIGGFAATPLLPTTLEDTYFAIKTLFYLYPSFLYKNRDLLIKFLKQFLNKKNFKNPIQLLQMFEILKLLDSSLPGIFPDLIKRSLSSFQKTSSLDFRTLYAVWKLSLIASQRFSSSKVKQLFKKCSLKTLENLYYSGKILPNLWKEYKEMIFKAQNGDGGFGFYPGTTSFLENTYYALKILKSFSNSFEINKINECIQNGLNFVKACYNSDGGFSRKPGGISYLETTAYAIEILKLYKELK